MNLIATIAVFVLSLGLSVISSLVLAAGLDKIGARLALSEGLFGLLTALGADAPEIAAAITALLAGHREVGVGVVLGSNIFNLAALLGLSALVAGQVRLRRATVLFNGGVALVVMSLAAALILGVLGVWLATGLILAVLALYAVLTSLRRAQIAPLPLPGPVIAFLKAAMTHRQEDQREDQTVPKASWMDALTVVPALVSIVLASVGMVHAAVALADRWGVPDHITGMFVLATLTGIPNVLAAVRLARRRRGAAVVSEVLNSNALNVLSGICGPALVIGLGTISARTSFAAWWLVGMTALVVILAAARRGLGRSGGAGIIALYAVFIGSSLFWP